MFRIKLMGVATAVAALTLAGTAQAQDTYEKCIENCGEQFGVKQDTAKKGKKVTKRVKKSTKVETKVETKTEDQTALIDREREIEAARAEERARAAEQYRAEEQRISEQHAMELEKVRSEERARIEADMRAKYQSDLDEARAIERARAASSVPGGDDFGAPITGFGTMVSVGGGVMNYTERGPLAVTNPGGFWDARLHLGTRSVIGLEAAYVGSAQDVNALGLNDAAFLMSNGVEGALRINAPVTFASGLLAPYAFGGLGWQHFGLVNEGSNTSSVAPYDDVMSIPMGVGISAGIAGVTLDTRATYRHTIGSDLVGNATYSFDEDALNQWSLGAGLGFEF